VIDEGIPMFGAPPVEEDEPEETGLLIPFPRMRANNKLTEAWSAELKRVNDVRSGQPRYEFFSPLDVVPKLMDFRHMPPMPWPAQWPETARRAKTYAGDCVGVVGAIGGGKTSFAIQCMRAAAGEGHPGLWANLELSRPEVLTRLVGNMHGVHASTVRDHWDRERIERTLVSITDMWRFVDHYVDLERQMAAMEAAIAMAWKVYRVPPLLVVDHLGQLVIGQRDERHAMALVAERFREMAERTSSFIMLLVQSSVSNQSVLTGRVELDAASDALGIETGGKAIGSACANTIGLAVFKADNAQALDAHGIFSKCRHTGNEGKIGLRFSKPGGVWEELPYLPTTPSEIRGDIEKDKKDKHRTAPPRNAEQARQDLNAARAGDADASRRSRIFAALERHGALGMEFTELRKLPGVGRGVLLTQSLQELQRAGSIERRPDNNRWRIITRQE
jgi:KaiC/GvpD/RAD55 family RecA-like ATPase